MNSRTSRFLFIFSLVFAGEMIFSLPFHTTRYYRPTFLEIFSFSNTQLGDVFAFYGVLAMVSYYLGGPVADRFSPRGLMTVSLAATAAGGLYLSTIPGFAGTATVFAWWGMTTIFLFWAAMIRATREWGGDQSQGLAFGLLDGGRGLVAAAMAVLAVMLLSEFMPDDVKQATDAQRLDGLRAVILFYSALTLLAAVLIWLTMPAMNPRTTSTHANPFGAMLQVMRRPIAWAHALIIISAYCGYKGLDNYSLYLVQVLDRDEVAAARFTAYAGYLRPVGCVVAGLIADRISSGRTTTIAFASLIGIYGFLAATVPSPSLVTIIFANLLVSYLAIYAFRGLYYALLEETRVPKHMTGATVGFIAFIGYTPDAFFGPVTGRILDASPGLAGHQNYFLFLTCMSVMGLIAVFTLGWLNRREEEIHAQVA